MCGFWPMYGICRHLVSFTVVGLDSEQAFESLSKKPFHQLNLGVRSFGVRDARRNFKPSQKEKTRTLLKDWALLLFGLLFQFLYFFILFACIAR